MRPAPFFGPGLDLVLSLALLFVLLFCVLFTVHAAVLDGFRGQTLGKMVFGVKVVREDDEGVPGPGRAALRALTFLLVDMIAGPFVMLYSAKRQRPGEVAAGTLVVRSRRRRETGGRVSS